MKHSLPAPPRRTSTTRKAVVTGGLVAITLAGVGAAAFAAFNATTSASQSVGSGTVSFVDISADGPGQRLSVAATDIAAGDTIQRAVTLTNDGSIDMATPVTLTTAATSSSVLDSDTTDGLQMVIDKCPVAWTESPSAPYTYTCAGTTSTVLASTPVIGANRALANIAVTAGTPNHLRVTLTLPSTAGNTFQGKSSVISYTFTGQQRAATAR
jgi:hypothetical protein